MICYSQLKLSQLAEINELRKKAYALENNEIDFLLLTDNQINIDKFSVHFGAILNGQLIAAYRGTPIYDADLLEKMIQCKLHQLDFKVQFPIICTSMAVTDSNHRNKGIYKNLRRYMFDFFINKNFIRFISTSVIHSNWNNSLRDYGYKIYPHNFGWRDFFQNTNDNVQINYLNLNEENI